MLFQKKQNTAKRVAIGSAIAGVVGYAVGVLTAPKAGKDTRKDIKTATNKSIAQAEKELKNVQSELDKVMKQAKANGTKLSAKAKKELDDAAVKAKDAKEKAREVLGAIREGKADDKQLNKAIKEANDSIEHLKQYLKKK